MLVIHLYGVALDGDATFSLQVHAVEHLLVKLTVGKRTGVFQQAVGQGALAVVDMGNDTEVTGVFHRVQKYD